MVDALTYTSMENIINSESQLNNLAAYAYILSDNPQTISNALTGVLDETTIKRACCLQYANPANPDYYLINVKIPLPKDSNLNPAYGQDWVDGQYNMFDKTIQVPRSMCPSGYTNGSTLCNNFYKVYCSNIVQDYKNLTGRQTFSDQNVGNFGSDYTIFNNFYKPECSCYGDIPSWIPSTVSENIPPKCVIPGCIPGRPAIYLDNLSQSPAPCSLSICTATINYNDISAEDRVEIQTQLKQQCGTYGPNNEENNNNNNNNNNNIIPDVEGIITPINLAIGGSVSFLICCVFIIIIIAIFYFMM